MAEQGVNAPDAAAMRAVSGLPEALGWVAKKAAYTFLPPSVLCLIVYLKGFVRFCRDGEKRRWITQRLGDFYGGQLSRARLLGVACGFMQYRELRYLTRVILPQRLPLDALVEARGLQHLDAALAQGKGVLLLTGHVGYPHTIDLVLRRLGFDVRQLTNRPAEQASYFLDRDLSRWPQLQKISRRLIKFPVFVDPVVTSLNLRPIYGLLERNAALVLLADGLAASRIVTSRLLGSPKPISASTLELGRYRGVPYLPIFLVRKRLWSPRLTLIIHEPLAMQYSDDQDADIQVNADCYTRILEGYVRAFPELHEGFDYKNLLRISRTSLEERYTASYPHVTPDADATGI